MKMLRKTFIFPPTCGVAAGMFIRLTGRRQVRVPPQGYRFYPSGRWDFHFPPSLTTLLLQNTQRTQICIYLYTWMDQEIMTELLRSAQLWKGLTNLPA